MIRRALALVVMVWLLGFLWFSVSLPAPTSYGNTDGVIVPTGSGGRIEHGLDVLREGKARAMLVSGVDPDVKPKEFAAEYKVSAQVMNCCITLDYAAVDTRSNASETARWVRERGYQSVRLVTTDWHMRRALYELRQALPSDVRIISDAVASSPSLSMLFLEYNKLLVTVAYGWFDGDSDGAPAPPPSPAPEPSPATADNPASKT